MALTPEQRIVRARTALMLDYPWFGSMVLRLRVESTRDGKSGDGQSIPTMATDGNRLVYNPEWLAKITEQELIGVLAHEVMHCALLHPFRRGKREPVRANIAMDLAINPLLLEAQSSGGNGNVKELKLPGVGRTVQEMQAGAVGYLYDVKFRNADGSWMGFETIYNLLPTELSPQLVQAGGMGRCEDSPKDKGRGKGKDKGKGDGKEEGEGEGQGDDDGEGEGEGLTESDWQIAVKQAEMVATKAGKMPGGVSRGIKAVRETEVDWRTLLRRFVTQTYRHDSTWARPSRRGMAMGLLIPGVLKENTGEIVVAIDTSGSITEDMLAQFCGEIRAIHGETRPEVLHVVYCDAAINGWDKYGADDVVELTMKGGGGTSFTPVFDEVEKRGIEPKCLIYLTDLESWDKPKEPAYPVMWVTPDWVTKGWEWGEVVRIKC